MADYSNKPDAIVYDRYTEKYLTGGIITFDRRKNREKSTSEHCRFNTMAINMMKLEKNNYVQFVEMGEEWFVKRTILQRGYRLISGGTYLRFYSTYFVNKFLSDLRYSEKIIQFKIKKTNHEFDGEPLFKIITDRPYKIIREKN